MTMDLRDPPVDKLRDYLRIFEAAEYLDVYPITPRNRGNTRITMTYRHSVNKYRLFKRGDLDALLKQ